MSAAVEAAGRSLRFLPLTLLAVFVAVGLGIEVGTRGAPDPWTKAPLMVLLAWAVWRSRRAPSPPQDRSPR